MFASTLRSYAAPMPDPYNFEIEGKDPIWICGCGLSNNKPYCDSSHKKVRDEDPNALYMYDDEQNRVKVPD